PVRGDRGRDPSDLRRARARPLPGRCGACAPGPPRHARPDLLRAHLPRARSHAGRAARPRRGADARVPCARPGHVPAARAGQAGRRAGRHVSLRLQRRQRGRGRRLSGRAPAIPPDCGRRRGDARRRRRRARARPRGSRRCRRGSPPADREEGGARVSVVIAILGLAFLILVHEAGHFFTALAVGMRPRRFYVGFPPPLVKTTRKGIEYGIGAIPLGGYVKIPGMHRPAESDADVYFGRTLRERPELAGPIQRLKRALAAEDESGARAALDELREWRRLEAADPPDGFDRALQELEDGLLPQAYWRQRTWKRIVVILAGPATNLVFAVALFAALFYVGGGKATSTVDQVLAGRPAAAIGLRPGDRVLTVNDVVVQPSDIAS